jgi:hypothetical protein
MAATCKRITTILLLLLTYVVLGLAQKKNLILDTDLFSDVE